MAEPGSLCCSRDRQSPPMAQCHFTLHRTEQLFVPSTVCEGYSSFPPCAQGEGRRVVPVGRVWCFSSVKQITLVVAARGCYRSHSAVELGRINEHHPQSPALTAGKSFLGSQPTLGLCCWKILAPGMPECLTWISLIPAQRILQVETHVLLKPSLGCCQGPQPGQRCCAEPSSGELLLFAPATSLWGRIPQLQWKHNTHCCCCCCSGGAGEQVAGGGQSAVGSSFFPCISICWRVGSCLLWAENALLTTQGSRTDPSAWPGAAGAS